MPQNDIRLRGVLRNKAISLHTRFRAVMSPASGMGRPRHFLKSGALIHYRARLLITWHVCSFGEPIFLMISVALLFHVRY